MSTIPFDTITLSKKIESSWSSWKIVPNLTKENEFIQNVILNYDKFEKKVILRIILALVGLESQLKSKYQEQIKNLLSKASMDKDEVLELNKIILIII